MASFRILHVDDDEDIRLLVELALDPAMNLTLDSYASGDAALDGALLHRPDLALVDVMMPGMDGVALAAAFREEPSLREVPIVFVTAKAYPEEVEHLGTAGAVEVLVKPFDLAALEDLVRSLLPQPGLS